MQLTGELAPLGYAHRETEFVVAPVGPVKGQRIYGACGPTALGSAASAALQRLVTTEQVYSLMEPRGLCDAQGITDDGKIAAAATSAGGLGLSIMEHHPYSGDVWAAWATFLGWHLGSRDHPTVIELAHGQALHDEISGLGENASGLTYHFIALIKRHTGGYSAYAGRTLPAGYWACDGDNYAGGNNRTTGFAAADVLQFYSDATLAAALPCAAVAFGRTPAAATSSGSTGGVGTTSGTQTGTGDFPVLEIAETGGFFTANPDGSWGYKNAAGAEDKLYGAILTYYRNNAGMRLFGVPVSEEIIVTPGYDGTLRLFERGAIAYDPEHKWDRVPGETDPQCYAAHVDHGAAYDHYTAPLQAALSAAHQQLATAQAAQAQAVQAMKDAQAAQATAEQQAATAQAQAAQAEQQAQQAASSAQPAPLTAAQQSDLAAMAALRAALG